MEFNSVIFLVLAALLMATCYGDGSGKFKNCGSVPFNVTWSPNPISPSQHLEIKVEYKVPHDLDGGFYNLTAWFHGDEYPFLGFADKFDCSKISEYVPCPLRKGLQFHLTKTLQHIPNIGSYPGDYDVRIEVKNRKQQEMICMVGRVIISKN